MIRLPLFLLAILCMEKMPAQNLLANGTFDDRNICTELHAICAPEGWFRIPLSPVSNGKGTAGFFLGDHHENIVMENVKSPGISRTYIYTRLLCPLEKGRDYIFTASFRTPGDEPFIHVNLLWTDFEPFHYQDRTSKATNRLTLTKENLTRELPKYFKEYSIRFTATGEEQYLLIGNLKKEIFPGRPHSGFLIIYEIDDATLLPADTSIKSCKERTHNEEVLYSNNFRHTPGKFIDNVEPPAPPKPDIPKDPVVTVIPPQVIVPPVINDTLVIPDVLFKFDKSELNPAFAYRLDTLIDKIKNKTFKRIEVLGHTDSLGADLYNQRLSQNRAIIVKNYLIDRLHYPEDIIISKGFAATMPVTSNQTSAGRQRNRRVEIVLVR